MSTPPIPFITEPIDDAAPLLPDPVPPVLPTIQATAAPTGPAAFIASCLEPARAVKQKYNVPIAALIAQAALESGWGQHVVQNAYFGIKGHAPTGNAVSFQTTEVIDGQVVHEAQTFRAYTSFADAADDYGRFLTTNPRYAGCFHYANDPVNFIKTLAAAGYATDPNYAPKLIALMQGHNLIAYDAA